MDKLYLSHLLGRQAVVMGFFRNDRRSITEEDKQILQVLFDKLDENQQTIIKQVVNTYLTAQTQILDLTLYYTKGRSIGNNMIEQMKEAWRTIYNLFKEAAVQEG